MAKQHIGCNPTQNTSTCPHTSLYSAVIKVQVGSMPQIIPAFASHIMPAAQTESSARLHGYCRECLESLNPRLLALHLCRKHLIVAHKEEAHAATLFNCNGIAWQTCFTIVHDSKSLLSKA